MANRPRRPKAGNEPSTIDTGQTDPNSPIQMGAPDDVSVLASGDEAIVSADTSRSDEAGAGRDPAAAGSTSRALPPLDEPPGTAPEAIRQQRAGEDARKAQALDTGSDEAGPQGTDETSATQIFAAEEGLASKAGEPPRRHLGEFEDDETLAASEPHEPHPASTTDAYRTVGEAHVASESHSGGPSTGSIVGAGLAGAVLALLGGSLLVYSGLLPIGNQTSTPGQYAEAGALEALSSEVGTLRATVDQLQSAEAAGGSGTNFASAMDLTTLGDRVTAAEQALQNQPQGVDTGALDAVEAEATSARDAASAAQGSADEARTLAQEAQSLAGEAQTLASDAGTRLDEVQARLDELASAQAQSRTALAAAGLKSAIDRGGSFSAELDGFASAGGSEEAVESLRAFASAGVPTQSELAAEWTGVEADIRRALIQPDAEAGVGSQLLAGLSSLVTVRSTSEEATAADPQSPDATLGRMRDAMASGDLGGWLEQRETLSEPAKAASQSLAQRVEARRETLSIVDTALTQATGIAPAQEG